jgi:hypothetical protein
VQQSEQIAAPLQRRKWRRRNLSIGTLELTLCILDSAKVCNLLRFSNASRSAVCPVFVFPEKPSSMQSRMACRAVAIRSSRFTGSVSNETSSQSCRHFESVLSVIGVLIKRTNRDSQPLNVYSLCTLSDGKQILNLYRFFAMEDRKGGRSARAS